MRTPKTVLLLLLTIALIRFEDDALAAVTRIEVVSSGPYGEFASGPYTRWDLRVAGELAPAAEAIRDLDKAGRNARGLVEYATRVTLIAPTNPARGNGTLHIDVPNRGRVIASSLYNGPRRDLIALGSFDPGTGFLEDCGYAIAAVTWELGFGVELPSFPGADGTPRFVEGTAFAIVRDVADFLSNGAADAKGRPNPLAGAIDRTLALGYSQTGRFLKSFLLGGFNMVGDHRVFAGMHILGAASGHIVLGSVPAPGSGAGAIPTFADPERRGVNEEPLALGDVMDQVSADSRPKMVFVNTTTDYFSLRGSLGRTGGVGGARQAHTGERSRV